MNIQKLTLDNFQSYDNEEIAFEQGVSLLHGDNGSGKSTILRAIFAGLFQTDMSRHAASEFDSIGELVKRNTTEGGVTIEFTVGGTEYELSWRISVEDPDTETPKGKTEQCLLDSPSFSSPISGVTAVREAIQSDIVGMNARAFTNSVYVQQDEVMRLISADKAERKEIFDDLLGLSKLDDYIDRTVEMRREAKRTRQDAATRRDELQSQLDEEYPDRETLINQQQELGSKLNTAKNTRESLEKRNDSLENTEEELQEQISQYSTLEAEQETLTEKIDKLNERMASENSTIQTLENEIETHRTEKWETRREINEIDDAIDGYDLQTADDADAAEQEANQAYVEASQTETKTSQTVTTTRETLQDERNRVLDHAGALRELFEQHSANAAQINRLDAAESTARQELKTAETERDEAVRAFLDANDVPTVIDQETRTRVEKAVQTLDDRREAAGNEVTRLTAERENVRKRIDRLQETIDSLETDRQDAIDSLPGDLVGEDGEVEAMSRKLNAANGLREVLETVDSPPVTQSNLEQMRDTTLPELREQLTTNREETVDELVRLRTSVQSLEEQLETQRQLEQGSCPVCDQAVTDHDAPREQLERELTQVTEALAATEETRETLTVDQTALSSLGAIVKEALLIRSVTEYTEQLEAERATQERARSRLESLNGEITAEEDKRDRLGARVESARTDVLGRFDAVESASDAVEAAVADVSAAETTQAEVISDLYESCEELAAATQAVTDQETALAAAERAHADAEQAVRTAEETLSTVKEAVSLHSDRADHEAAIDAKTNEKDSKEEVVGTLREQRGQKQARVEEIAEKLETADISELRSKLSDTKTAIEETEADLATARERVDELNEQLAGVESKLETVDGLAGRIDTLDGEMSWAQGVVDEMNGLIDTYEQTKTSLRADNLKLINAYANEVFRELYASSSYERVILEEDYTIRLAKTDGTRITPSLSSGGESAIVNIALRAGLYRTIVERNQNKASGLPPFILDEPTTFLDDGHVRELETVIESIKQWNVSQLIVVSHNEALIDAADYEYEVNKNTTTDASSCTRTQLTTSSGR
jgi:DNA repair exonuclease SbcCD ATPase subunit